MLEIQPNNQIIPYTPTHYSYQVCIFRDIYKGGVQLNICSLVKFYLTSLTHPNIGFLARANYYHREERIEYLRVIGQNSIPGGMPNNSV